MTRLCSVDELKQLAQRHAAARDERKTTLVVCAGTGCRATRSFQVYEAFQAAVKQRGLEAGVEVRASGCHGFCERGPLLVIKPKGIFYQHVAIEDVDEVLDRSVLKDELVERLLWIEPDGTPIVQEHEIPFYKHQRRLIFGNNGEIDPSRIEDYLAIGGYQAMAKALTKMAPPDIINEIKKANLRGRGGGGFPAGIKWESTAAAKEEPKYILCNADEGDPGAFMDRSLLEGNPHLVIEGMIIGAYAIGSSKGYVYVRNEYPLAVINLNIALKQARELGLIGDNILGTGFSFDLQINRGGGAFVCGESSALMASIEGRPGEPRAKFVHMAESGLYGKPSNLNNVETWANVPLIIDKGADWYCSIGTAGSKGTKIFSLVGKINNTGLVEVPMGITLREIVYDIGGGIPGGKKFKAVQTGGPSGGCIPAEHLDLPVDFDKLFEVGSMMGSGGLIVMDENTCMVDVAHYFTNFLAKESCGKCTPCRDGLHQMLHVLGEIREGRGRSGDIEFLKEIAECLADASLCALGQTAANPVLTTLRYFRDEYEAHISGHKCPAGVCKALISYRVIEDKCTACGLCRKVCPVEAISGAKKVVHKIDLQKCIKCGACIEACKFDAIEKQ